MEEGPTIDFVYKTGRPRKLPRVDNKVYNCVPDPSRSFCVKVRFRPSTKEADVSTVWKVSLYMDNENVCYCRGTKPDHDGWCEAVFNGWRANADCTELKEFVFSMPDEGSGGCGVAKCKVRKGREVPINAHGIPAAAPHTVQLEGCAGEPRKREREEPVDEGTWKRARVAGVAAGSSAAAGEVCTSGGPRVCGSGTSTRLLSAARRLARASPAPPVAVDKVFKMMGPSGFATTTRCSPQRSTTHPSPLLFLTVSLRLKRRCGGSHQSERQLWEWACSAYYSGRQMKNGEAVIRVKKEGSHTRPLQGGR